MQIATDTVTGKLGGPEEIASLVAYLAAPEAHFITGQTVDVILLKAVALLTKSIVIYQWGLVSRSRLRSFFDYGITARTTSIYGAQLFVRVDKISVETRRSAFWGKLSADR